MGMKPKAFCWLNLEDMKNIFKSNFFRIFKNNSQSKLWIESSEDLFQNHQPDYSGIDDPECFHRAIGPILATAQIFGILPVAEVCSKNPNKLNFKITSFRVYYTIALIILLAGRLFIPMNYIVRVFIKTSNSDERSEAFGIIPELPVFVNCVLGIVFFYWLSPKWIQLQQEWRIMEKKLNGFNHNRPKLRCKFKTISLIMLAVSFIDNTLYMIYVWSKPNLENSKRFWNVFSADVYTKLQTFYIINNIFFMDLCVFIVENIGVFIWNFTDLFIILVSTGIVERYKFLNEEIISSIPRNRYAIHWLQLREKFTILSNLVKRTDECISPLILLSFVTNIFYICLQLFSGLSLEDNLTIMGVLFTYSTFVFVVGRTIAITLSVSRIYDQSKEALPALYNCPASCYTIETERLQHQLTSDEVMLTGMNFFSVTRNFLLAIFGAVTTYEIILLQFKPE